MSKRRSCREPLLVRNHWVVLEIAAAVNLLALARARRSTSMQVHEVFYQLRPANRMPLCGFIVWQSRLE